MPRDNEKLERIIRSMSGMITSLEELLAILRLMLKSNTILPELRKRADEAIRRYENWKKQYTIEQ